MARLNRRASLLVALFLLTSAATVHAECAWVLWQNAVTVVDVSGTVNSGGWKPNDSFDSLQACRMTRDQFGRVYPPPEPVRVGAQYSEYACFPDTVDQRGPKGK